MGRKRQRTSGAAEHSEEAKGASSKSGGGSGKREAIVDVLADKFLAQGDDRDFASLPLKKDHEQRPMWVLPTGMIFLEATSPLYSIVHDFLVAIAEPVSRPEFLHEYRLTQNSLFTAVSIGLDTEGILTYLDRFSKVAITDNVRRFVRECTKTHGKVKLVLRGGRYFVESTESALLEKLLTHTVIAEARDEAQSRQGGVVGETASSPALQETATAESGLVFHAGALGSMEEDQTTWAARRLETEWYEREEEELQEFLHDMHGKPSKVGACSRPAMRPLTLLVRGRAQVFSFEVVDHAYERVREAALRMGIPLMEEYDFKLDRKNPDIVYHLKVRGGGGSAVASAARLMAVSACAAQHVHPELPGDIAEQDLRERPRAVGHHCAAVRGGQDLGRGHSGGHREERGGGPHHQLCGRRPVAPTVPPVDRHSPGARRLLHAGGAGQVGRPLHSYLHLLHGVIQGACVCLPPPLPLCSKPRRAGRGQHAHGWSGARRGSGLRTPRR